MKILIMGAGKMGSFFIDLLSFDHEVAAYERDARRLRFTYNCQRFTSLEEVKGFQPELVINAGEDRLERLVRPMWTPLCLYAPNVRSNLCQSQSAK